MSERNLPPMEVPARVLRTARQDTSSVPDGDGLDLLIAGVADSGCQEKEAWMSLRMSDHSYWGKVKSREKPAPRLTELTNLPPSIQRAFVVRWACQLRLRVSDGDSQTRAAVTLLKAAADFLAESA